MSFVYKTSLSAHHNCYMDLGSLIKTQDHFFPPSSSSSPQFLCLVGLGYRLHIHVIIRSPRTVAMQELTPRSDDRVISTIAHGTIF